VPSSRFAALCIVLTLPFTAFGYLRETLPVQTHASREVARIIASQTAKHEVVLTNLRVGAPPFESWDAAAWGQVATLADRLVGVEITGPASIPDKFGTKLRRNGEHLVFALSPEHPIDANWSEKIKHDGVLFATEEIRFRPSATPLMARLRERVWRWTGRYAGRVKTQDEALIHLQFYRMPPGWLNAAFTP
jgi:hypothetical protein